MRANDHSHPGTHTVMNAPATTQTRPHARTYTTAVSIVAAPLSPRSHPYTPRASTYADTLLATMLKDRECEALCTLSDPPTAQSSDYCCPPPPPTHIQTHQTTAIAQVFALGLGCADGATQTQSLRTSVPVR
eukprot:6172201-Pleurochrysis_carterae.AAC.3